MYDENSGSSGSAQRLRRCPSRGRSTFCSLATRIRITCDRANTQLRCGVRVEPCGAAPAGWLHARTAVSNGWMVRPICGRCARDDNFATRNTPCPIRRRCRHTDSRRVVIGPAPACVARPYSVTFFQMAPYSVTNTHIQSQIPIFSHVTEFGHA